MTNIPGRGFLEISFVCIPRVLIPVRRKYALTIACFKSEANSTNATEKVYESQFSQDPSFLKSDKQS